MTLKIRIVSLWVGLGLMACTVIHAQDEAATTADWPQWGLTSLHNSSTQALGQTPEVKLAHFTYDPFVSHEKAEEAGHLLAHYQVPLIDGESVFLEYKTGKYVACDPPG
jgi:hypothetical protein